jgi:hypothetical protein
MQKAWTTVLTDKGAELIASALGGTLNYTMVKLGAGTVDEAELAQQTDVTDYVKDFDIVKLSAEGPVSTVNARINNVGLAENKLLAQIGLFASVEGEAEALLVIYQAKTPSTIPTVEEQPGWLFEAQLDLTVSNIANFTANINWGAYATLDEVRDAINHVPKVLQSVDGVHGIRYSVNELQVFVDGAWISAINIYSDLLNLFRAAAAGERVLIGFDGATDTMFGYPAHIMEPDIAYLGASWLGVAYLGEAP